MHINNVKYPFAITWIYLSSVINKSKDLWHWKKFSFTSIENIDSKI